MSFSERSPVTTLATLKSHSARRLAPVRAPRAWRGGIFPLIFLLCGLLCGLLFGFASLPAHAAAGVTSALSPQTTKAPTGANRASTSSTGATITFRKIFKSSYPEFVEIKLQQNGMGTFDIRQLDDDPNPQPFDLSVPVAQKIFDLAAKLHNFQGVDLGVHRRVANLGIKPFGTKMAVSPTKRHSTTLSMPLQISCSTCSKGSPVRNPISPICSAPCAMTGSG